MSEVDESSKDAMPTSFVDIVHQQINSVIGTNNGLTSPYQYRSALDILTPKLNLNIVNEKESKLISLFSSDDIKIIEEILDNGSGAKAWKL